VTKGALTLFKIHEWLSNYPGAKLNINQWSSAGVPDPNRTDARTGLTAQPTEDTKRVRRIGNYLGDIWLTWEEVQKRINEAPLSEKGNF